MLLKRPFASASATTTDCREFGYQADDQWAKLPSGWDWTEVAAVATDAPDPSIERYAGGTRTHVVRRGESLGLIAKRYHTTVKSIMAINGMKRSIIFPGQALVVAGRPRRSSTANRPSHAKQAKGGIAQAGALRSPR